MSNFTCSQIEIEQDVSRGFDLNFVHDLLTWSVIDRYVYVVHNQDNKADCKTPRDEHIHVLLKFSSGTTSDVILNHCDKIKPGVIGFEQLEKIKNWCSAVNYLTHRDEVMEHPYKHVYELSDLVASYDITEDAEAGHYKKLKFLNKSTGSNYSIDAYNLGLQFGSIDDYLQKLSSKNARAYKTYKSVITDSYQRGVNMAMNEKNDIDRVCIYISSIAGNKGKSETARRALLSLGVQTSEIVKAQSSRYGGLDNVSGHHRALILDDVSSKYAHQMSEQKPVPIQVRGKGTVPFCAEYVIATGNVSFRDWYCHEQYCNLPQQYQAACTRWYVIDMNGSEPKIVNYACRGSAEDIMRVNLKFKAWFDAFVDNLKTYSPAPEDFSEFSFKYPECAEYYVKLNNSNSFDKFTSVYKKHIDECDKYRDVEYDDVLDDGTPVTVHGVYACPCELKYLPLYYFLTGVSDWDEERSYNAYIESLVDEYVKSHPTVKVY